jgi:UDP-3-O-[3-hydroxymyristoyl] glucosamine N-acyltransferase
MTLAELAEIVQGEVVGDGALVIHGLASLEQAQPGELTFVAERKYAPLLADSRASAVLVDGAEAVDRAAIRASNPSVAFFTLLDHFFPPQHPDWGIDKHAVIAPEAQMGQHVRIGPYAVIGRGARLGNRVIVYPGTYVGEDCVIGDDCILYANVSLYARVHLGQQVVIHSGAVLGADGFGFYPQADGSYRKIPQVGRVVIGDGVEIGANTCIDRAMLGDTVIETGAKLDNLIQIGHNVAIGPHTVMAAQVGLSGSVRVGAQVRMGGQVGVAEHATIGDGAAIGAQSGILGEIEPGAIVQGAPAVPHTMFKRIHFYNLRLGELFQQVRQLKRRLEQLEGRENGT